MTKLKNTTPELELTESSCRICLKPCSKDDQDCSKFSNQYNVCTGFTIRDEDVPRKICTSCISCLRKAYFFRNKCNKTEQIMLLLKTSTEIKEEMPITEMLIKVEPTTLFQQLKRKRIKKKLPPAMCDICGKSVCDKYRLTEHRKIHTREPNAPKLYCDICITQNPQTPVEKFSYLSKSLIGVHMRRMHLHKKLESYACSYCGKLFQIKGNLRYHIINNHTDPQEFQHVCKFCLKRFKEKNQLTLHEAIHTGVKKYGCDVCGLKFRSSGRRVQHIQTVHTVQVHVCEICSKTFNSRKYFSQHMKSHKLDYKCPICPDKRFSLTTTLRSHMASNHPEVKMPPSGTTLKNFDWNKLFSS